jgi:hypothetical protein
MSISLDLEVPLGLVAASDLNLTIPPRSCTAVRTVHQKHLNGMKSTEEKCTARKSLLYNVEVLVASVEAIKEKFQGSSTREQTCSLWSSLIELVGNI